MNLRFLDAVSWHWQLAGGERGRENGSACQGRVRPAEEFTWLQLKESIGIGSVVPGVVLAEIGQSSVASKCP